MHEMLKLRKEEEKKEEWKKERIIFLVIQLNGEGQREEEPWI